MKVLLFYIVTGFFCIRGSLSSSQMQHSRKVGGEPITKKLLWAQWRSTKDKNSILVFKGSICIDYYGKNAIDTLTFVISKSCNIKDSIKAADLSQIIGIIRFKNVMKYLILIKKLLVI